ncbi:MAG: glycosyltransferase [Acetobacteraceae bacterium]|nr:glycosyltransferase [Acetobacteraceae bacterium]
MPGEPEAAAARRVAVVTVTHDSAGVIADFLAACPPGVAVTVVDNASADAGAALAAAAGARVIRNAANLGFGAACNLGLAAAEREFVLLANPDARLSPAAVAALVAAADAFPDAAILAPGIRDAEGQPVRSWDADQRRRRRLPRRRDTEPWPAGPICVEHVSGACMLLRRDDGLRFDPGYFLYYEDDDLCAEARRRGRSVVLVPAAVVTHAGGASSAPSAALSAFKARHMAWSRLRYMAKHAGAAAARREAAARLPHHAGKALGHALTLRFDRARADLAGLGGTLAWLRGRR